MTSLSLNFFRTYCGQNQCAKFFVSNHLQISVCFCNIRFLAEAEMKFKAETEAEAVNSVIVGRFKV